MPQEFKQMVKNLQGAGIEVIRPLNAGETADGETFSHALPDQSRSNCFAPVTSCDKSARIQNGNNNAYREDNELSWLSRNMVRGAKLLLTFKQKH